MATKQFMGGTAPLVDDQGDGTHYPLVKVVAEGQGGLTNEQLRASALPTAPNVSRGAGTTDANTLRVTMATDSPLQAAVGAAADAAATADVGAFSLVALVKRGLANWTTLLARMPALVNNRLPVQNSVPTAASGTILPLMTSNTGSVFTAFGTAACVALDIVNNTGTTIEYRRGAVGTAMQIPTGSARLVVGITNANQIDVRRTDTSNTPVTLQAEAFTA